jgi:hypothetical protein
VLELPSAVGHSGFLPDLAMTWRWSGLLQYRCQFAVLWEEIWVSDSSRREADFQKLLTVFNAEISLLLTAQSPKSARGRDWSMRIVRWQEGDNNVRGIEVRCAPWLFAEFGAHLEGREDLVFYRSRPSGGKRLFSFTGRKAIFVRPPYERHRGFLTS